MEWQVVVQKMRELEWENQMEEIHQLVQRILKNCVTWGEHQPEVQWCYWKMQLAKGAQTAWDELVAGLQEEVLADLNMVKLDSEKDLEEEVE